MSAHFLPEPAKDGLDAPVGGLRIGKSRNYGDLLERQTLFEPKSYEQPLNVLQPGNRSGERCALLFEDEKSLGIGLWVRDLLEGGFIRFTGEAIGRPRHRPAETQQKALTRLERAEKTFQTVLHLLAGELGMLRPQ